MNDVHRLVSDIIERYRRDPVDMLGLGDGDGEFRYLSGLAESYARTVEDVHRLFEGKKPSARILEIGAYLGVTSLALQALGYEVSACEHPAYHASPRLSAVYAKAGIPFRAADLSAAQLPFDDDAFDAVIICEVIEHLNFNPLPVLLEINRVIRPGGCIYVGMPNHASLANRLKALRGKSIHNPVSDLLNQLDSRKNMQVGLHWREYTAQETCQMLEITGFERVLVKHDVPAAYFGGNPVKAAIKRAIFSMQTLRPMQVVIGRKQSRPEFPYWRRAA